MTATTRSRDVAVLPLLRSTTWRSAVHVLTDMWAGILTFTAMVVLLSITVSLAITVVLAVPFAWATIVAARWLGRMERARARVLLGVDVADPHTPRAGGWWSRLRQAVVSGAVWREIGYHLLLLPLGLVGWTLAVVAWSGSLFLVTLPATVWLMPDDVADLGPIEAGIGGATGLALLGGVALCVVAPWITTTWARLDAALVRGLLGPSASTRLEQRVDTLTTTRALAVDAAEEERRRIERDLHDGAQQRLVALAIDLGMARSKMDSDPEAARLLLDQAHEEAKRAIAELRDLARGIHPVALTDRGLPGAVPGLAARAPIPVDVRVDVPERPVPAIEGIAYFVVSEALTNVAKHAEATRAQITVERRGPRLLVDVRDDGRGGASASLGSGLRGLADRVAAVDGTFGMVSPVGGPTVVTADLPCVLDGRTDERSAP